MEFKIVHESFKLIHGIWGTKFKDVETVSEGCYVKNDWASFQVLMKLDERSVVSVDDEPAFHKRGVADSLRFEILVNGQKEETASLKFIDLVEDDDLQLKADRISDQRYKLYDKDEIANLWFEMEIPEEMKAGRYDISILVYRSRVFEEEVFLDTLQYTVNIKNVSLPKAEDYKFYLDLWQHNSNIARKYDVALWSDEHFSIIENYVLSLARLGQKAVSVVVSEIPWSGQNSINNPIDSADLYEYSMIKTTLGKDGFKFDFTALNRYMDLCKSYGIDQEIEVFGLMNIWIKEDYGFGQVFTDYDDGVRVRYYDENAKVFKYMDKKAEYIQFVKAVEANFIQQGVIENVRVIADEPAEFQRYLNRIVTVHEIAPALYFKAAINEMEFMQKEIPGIKDYCPILDHIVNDLDNFEKIKKDCTGRISYYVCCWPKKPNTFIGSPLIEARLIPWLAQYLGVEGFLRWNYTVWPDDPMNRIRYGYPEWSAGDTNFVYPGKTGKPLLSLRYKQLLRGIQDVELIEMGKEKGISLQSVINENFKLEKDYPRGYNFYETQMKELLEKIEE